VDKVSIVQVKHEHESLRKYWGKWYCLNKSGSESLYLQRDGSWSRGCFYFDTERQLRSLLILYHPSTTIQREPEPEHESDSFRPFSSSDDDNDTSSSLDLGGLLGGGSDSSFSGGGGDFGGGGAGGDW
jgi:uncharacterized membrane protein YgcG